MARLRAGEGGGPRDFGEKILSYCLYRSAMMRGRAVVSSWPDVWAKLANANALLGHLEARNPIVE